MDDGGWFGVLLCVGAAVVAVLAWFAAGVELAPERRRRWTRASASSSRVVAVAAVAAVLARNGGKVLDEFRGEVGER